MAEKSKSSGRKRSTAKKAKPTKSSPKKSNSKAPSEPRSGFWGGIQDFLEDPDGLKNLSKHLPSWSDEVGGLTLIMVGVLTFAAVLNPTGEAALSSSIATSLTQAFGLGAFIVSLTILAIGVILLLPKVGITIRFNWIQIIALEVAFVAFEGLLHLFYFTDEGRALARAGEGGGYVGWTISSLLRSVITDIPAISVLLVVLFVSLFYFLGITRRDIIVFFAMLGTQLEALANRLQPEPKPVVETPVTTVTASDASDTTHAVESQTPTETAVASSGQPSAEAMPTDTVATTPSDKLTTEVAQKDVALSSEASALTTKPETASTSADRPQASPPTDLPGQGIKAVPTQSKSVTGTPEEPQTLPASAQNTSTQETTVTESSTSAPADQSQDATIEPASQSPESVGESETPSSEPLVSMEQMLEENIEYKTMIINGEEVKIPVNKAQAEEEAQPVMMSPVAEANRRRLEGQRYFTVDGFQDRYLWVDERDPMLPPFELLRYADLKLPSEDEVNTNAELITNTMNEFDIEADVIDVRIGPTVTQYAISPIKEVVDEKTGEVRLVRTRVTKIANLANDFALALSTRRLRIQAPVPGSSYVGIEVPNKEPSLVSIRSVMETEQFYRKKHNPLSIPLGRDVSGDPIVTDLASMPHLLIAGTTGSGKSVCLTSMITSLVVNNFPDKVRLILLDPKMVELTRFEGLPHLMGPVETDVERIIGVLRWSAREMDRRYKLLELENARNLEAYNAILGEERADEHIPYIVIAIDEIGDLMMSRPDETEKTLTRLAQKARAAGMHLIVATQRPSVDVITGLIKANFPARLSFSVASGTDSRVILDSTGAETLVGKGDMLFLAPDASGPLRCQGCFISDEEMYEIVMYWKAWAEEQESIEKERDSRVAPWEQSMTRLEALSKLDPILEEALQMVVAEGRASVSQIQKRMGIDYPRAAKLMDSLRELGIIGGTLAGGRNRKVLVKSVEEARRMIHNNRRITKDD